MTLTMVVEKTQTEDVLTYYCSYLLIHTKCEFVAVPDPLSKYINCIAYMG